MKQLIMITALFMSFVGSAQKNKPKKIVPPPVIKEVPPPPKIEAPRKTIPKNASLLQWKKKRML